MRKFICFWVINYELLYINIYILTYSASETFLDLCYGPIFPLGIRNENMAQILALYACSWKYFVLLFIELTT